MFPTKRIALLGVLLALSFPDIGVAQNNRVRVEENVRSAPNGVLLGRLSAGTEIQAGDTEGQWVEFVLDGWMWTRSLRTIDRSGFDLVVSIAGGENIRSAPSGDVLGVLEDGTLLTELQRITGWVQVRRTMWIWSESLTLDASGSSGAPPGSIAPTPDQRFRSAGPSGLPVLAAPDGDTLLRLDPGTDVEVLAREGSWARVRVEGWAWLPRVVETEGEGAAVVDANPDEVAASPDDFRGRLVEWDLQFVSIERAEKVRTDFYEGEPFLLTRTVQTNDPIFVYVAIPPEKREEMDDLIPLSRIRVFGRIRVGAATLTGSPILDLLELRSGRLP